MEFPDIGEWDLKAIDNELTRRSMMGFAGHTLPQYTWNWHHEKIAKALDKFYKGEIKRLMIYCPPQHAKSTLTSQLFPAYALGKNPNLKIILGSYSASLAEGMNKIVQRHLSTPEYQELFPGTKLPSSGAGGTYVCNAEQFDIVGKDGYLKAVGVGGSTTGKPADIFIIDDPHKDREEAKSALISQKVWEWYTDVVYTRLHNNSGVLLIQTRWDDMDLAGRLLKQMEEAQQRGDENYDKWEILCFPAIKENDSNPDDPRQVGEALWPEKHDINRLRTIQSQSLRTFQSLYQQNPVPVQAGGECYKDFSGQANVGDYVSAIVDGLPNPWKYDPGLPLHVSFDFNVNPYMTAGVYQHHKTMVGDMPYYRVVKIEEICLRSPHNRTRGVCAHLRAKYGPVHKSTMYIYGDPNGRKESTNTEQGHNDYLVIRTELKRFNPKFRVATKAPAVSTRIGFMNAIFSFAMPELEYYIDKKCTNTINDYQYIKEESDGTKQKVKAIDPVTGINSERYGHTSDSDEYFFTMAFPNLYDKHQKGGVPPAPVNGKRVSRYGY